MDERGEPYPKRSRIDSTDEALSLNSNLPDELSLINCPPLSANNLFPASTGSGYVNNGNDMFISTSNPPTAENQNLWVGPRKVAADRVPSAEHSVSTNFQVPKSLNKMDPRLQTDSPSFAFGNGSIHHQMNAFSPSPTLVDGLGTSKVQAMVGQKRPFNSSIQSSQPTTHMLPLVPLTPMNPARVMSLNTAKDSGGMFSYSPLQVVAARPSPSNPNMSGDAIAVKKKLIQRQLVLLLHAYKCQRREQQGSPAGKGSTPAKPCNLSQCPLMKDVLNHMATCNEGKSCKMMHCSTSRQIIAHWRNCSKADCMICTPLRHCGDNNNNSNRGSVNFMANNHVVFLDGASNNILPSPNLGLAMSVNSNQSGIITINNSNTSSTGKPVMKPWHASVTEDLRNHLVKRLVQAIVPPGENNDLLKHPQIKGLVNYAKKVEGDNFDKADSRDEYYSLLADRIYKIQKDLEMHKFKKGMEQKQLQTDPHGRLVHDRKVPGTNVSFASAIGNGSNFGDSLAMNTQDRANIHLMPPNDVPASLQDLPGTSARKNPYIMKTESLTPPPMPHQNISMSSSSLLPDLNSLQVQAFDQKQTEAMKLSHSSYLFPPANESKSTQSKCVMSSNLQQLKAELMLSPFPSSIDSSTMSDSLFDVLSAAPTDGATGSPLECLSQFLPTSKMNDFIDCSISLGSLVNNESPLDSAFPVVSSCFSSSASAPQGIGTSNSICDLLNSSRQETFARSSCSPLFTPVSSSFANPFENIKIKREIEDTFPVKKEEEQNPRDGSCEGSFSLVKEEATEEVKMEDVKSIKEEVETKEEVWEATVIEPKVFRQEELYQAFLPSLDKMCMQEPDAIPFLQPVDVDRLCLPDYRDIIKNPMDLSTIRKKLESGQYVDPWQYINDVHLMFENAWLYNRKSSKVYKFCTKLSEIFQAEIDAPMKSLGFCCGQKLVFTPQALCCYGKELCTIARESTYYHYKNKYTYCEKCFNDILKAEVEIDDPSQPGLRVKKSEFLKEKNDKFEPELFVECADCRRRLHKICVLHFEPVYSQKFVCGACLKAKNGKRKLNKFTAKKLPNTKLGTYLESRVNQFLKKKDVGDAEVVIRVLSSLDKSVEVKSGMKQRFEDNFSTSFPYRVKTIFAFSEIDGADVCFFGMHVQEYGSDCPEPNSRRVYIAYLDSVNFFQPRKYRTPVYHEILLGYLDYVKSLGFVTAHIWACPPSEGDDYIFHCHPPDQKIPKPKRLQDWYKKMLDKGVEDRVIVEYKDILQDAQETQLSCITGLPYFEGDFWPTILEESIAEEKQKMIPKREEEEDEAEEFDNSAMFEKDDFLDSQIGHPNDKKKPHKNSNGKKRSLKNKKNSKSRSKSSFQQSGYDDLLYKLFSTMEKYKEVFFVIYLQNNIYSSFRHSPDCLPPIVDPDPIMNTDLMDGRDAFLTMCRERHLEFSSLRRAKFSSIALLYELHIQMREAAVCCTCQNCKVSVETRYHCMICEDFDLCVTCYSSAQHPHRMTKVGLGLEDPGPTSSSPGSGFLAGDKSNVHSGDSQLNNGNANDAMKRPQLTAMQRYEQALVHAASCRDANCRMGSCKKMKRLIAHLEMCRQKKVGGTQCSFCPQLMRLCLAHSRSCKEQNKCPVPGCNNARRKMEDKRNNERMKHELLTRRRILNMKFEENLVSPLSNSSKNANTGGKYAQLEDNFAMPGQYFNQPAAAAKPCPQANAMTPELPVAQQRTMTGGADFANYDSNSPSPMTASPHMQHLSPLSHQHLQSPQQRAPAANVASTSTGATGMSPPHKIHLQKLFNYLKSNNKNPNSISDIARILKSKPQLFATFLKLIKDKGNLKAGPAGARGSTISSSSLASDMDGGQHEQQIKNQQISLQFNSQSNFHQQSSQQQQHQATQQLPVAPHSLQPSHQMPVAQSPQMMQQVATQPTSIVQQPAQVFQQPSQLQQMQQVSTQSLTVMQNSQLQQQPQQVLQQKSLPQAQHQQQLQQIGQHVQQQQQQQHQWFQQDQQMASSMSFDPNLKTYQHHQLADGDGSSDNLKMFSDGSNYNYFPNNTGMWDKVMPMKGSMQPFQHKQLQQHLQHQQFLHQKAAIYSNQQTGDPAMADPMVRNRSRMVHPYQVNMMPFRGGNPGAQTSLTFDSSVKDASPVVSLTNNHASFQSSPSMQYMQVPNNTDISPSQQHIQQQQQQQQSMMRASFAPQDSSYQGNVPTFPNHQVLRTGVPVMRHAHQQHQQILNTQTFGYVSMDGLPGNSMPNSSYMQPTVQRFARPPNVGGQGQVRMHRPQFNQLGMKPVAQGDYYAGNNYSFPQQANFQQVQQQLIHQQSQMADPGLMCSPSSQHVNPIPPGAYSIQQAGQFQIASTQLLESSDDPGHHQMLPQQ